jgi:hypothetical protein
VERLRTHRAVRKTTSKKTKHSCQSAYGEKATRERREREREREGGLASRQGTSSPPLFIGMFLVPSFKM